ncbi:hypothetical protein [Falsiphaeobacter marinintestinus]|uniref:hypothetical protein n=1 Tax=Falsiphaeobacter marinintestinus TaxID=1492905 RepID=UPI0011B41AE5|nr:hypothetical protein [Phaeobacter marinintestinus]
MDENSLELRIAELNAKATRLSTILGFVGGGVATAVVGVTTGWFQFQTDDRKLDLELARLGLSILAGEYEPDNAQYTPARRFALRAVEKGTGITLSETDFEVWVLQGSTPLSKDLIAFGDVYKALTLAGIRDEQLDIRRWDVPIEILPPTHNTQDDQEEQFPSSPPD